MRDDEAWFVYRRSAGKMSAYPANAKGWAALIACIAGINLAAWLVYPTALRIHPVFGIAVLFAIVGGGVLLTLRIVRVKGRPSR